jgi:thiamine-phosphate pyrophosphorylase
MDPRLIAWARAAATRRRHNRRQAILWLFTDARRLPDPRPAVARLPIGLAGVVLRHDGDPGRSALARDLARICRARRLALVVAGDVRLAAAVGAGVHLRGGRWPSVVRPVMRHGRRLITSSAHGPADLLRAQRGGATLAFLSPAFPTASHPDVVALGTVRWSRLARMAPGLRIAALGGMDGATIRRLPRRVCRAVGAIGALA